MKVINVRKREMRLWFNTYWELELDNGEFVFFEGYDVNLKKVETEEELERMLEEECSGFWVLNESVIHKFKDVDEESEDEDVILDDYAVSGMYDNMYNVDYYNSYMELILGCKEIMEWYKCKMSKA